MAKAIPKPKAAKREKFLKSELRKLNVEVDERYTWAMKFLRKQDEATREAVERLVARMSEMAGPPVAHVIFPGEKHRTRIDVEPQLQERNHYYMAVRLIIACAKLDIRIGKWKFPNRCAENLCGRKV